MEGLEGLWWRRGSKTVYMGRAGKFVWRGRRESGWEMRAYDLLGFLGGGWRAGRGGGFGRWHRRRRLADGVGDTVLSLTAFCSLLYSDAL